MSEPVANAPRARTSSWQSFALAFALFGGVGFAVLFGAAALGVHSIKDAAPWIGAGVHGPWALPAAVASFAVLAFLGVPQFVLIAAAALAFGPWIGALYSWVGTLVSSLVGFGLGRRFGERALSAASGERVRRFTALVARNGLWASLVVRLVPSAPFILVNMAAGATPMSPFAFAAGTAIGIVPKIALTAFAGGAVADRLGAKGTASLVWLSAAVVVWIGAAIVARLWLRRRSRSGDPKEVS